MFQDPQYAPEILASLPGYSQNAPEPILSFLLTFAHASLALGSLCLATVFVLTALDRLTRISINKPAAYGISFLLVLYAAGYVLMDVSASTTVIAAALACQILAACGAAAGALTYIVLAYRATTQVPSAPSLAGALAQGLQSPPCTQQGASDPGVSQPVMPHDSETSLLVERFRSALDGSGIVAFEQDSDLRYQWLYNAPKAADGSDMHAHTDFDLFPAEVAESLAEVKQRVMETGTREVTEIAVPVEHGDLWYRIDIAPLSGRNGIAAVATDISELKATQARHQILMRELAHRIKNLLAVIDGIARQTAKSHTDIAAFEDIFSKRLRGLAATHDLLIQGDWRPLDLAELTRSQIAPTAGDLIDRISMSGPKIRVNGEVAQHLGLALHELTTNAVKYGALGSAGGRVDFHWDRETRDGADWLTIVWQETGGPDVVEPAGAGFGTFLTTRAVESGLRGKVEREFAKTGFIWRVAFPLV